MRIKDEFQERVFSFVLDRRDDVIVNLRKNNLAHHKLHAKVEEMLNELEKRFNGEDSGFVKELVSVIEFRDIMENKQCYMQGLKDCTMIEQLLGESLLEKYYACHLVTGVPDAFE